ncbi:Fungalysin metallopeptidase (M36) [Rhizoctonia solani]|uniref:Fungalysin metallopeptidase (M36) n=1 Tax=Rhizoctonia solani TaxID=456999 RepID=A0A8H7I5T4_9AGAM|nr:Fungalysin metallopeptidase (M36) [Rhizoctonia solani]
MILPNLARVASIISSGVLAAPWDASHSSATHHTRAIGPNQTKTYGVTGVDHLLSKRAANAFSSEAAKWFIASETGVHLDEVVHGTGHTIDGIFNKFFHQQFVRNGIRVANAVANVAMKGNKVILYGANFVKAKTIVPVATHVLQESAVKAAKLVTGATYNLHPIKLQYFIKDTEVHKVNLIALLYFASTN